MSEIDIPVRKAKVKIRRGPDWPVKPERDVPDGTEVVVSQGWKITEDEHSLYAGETAWVVEIPERMGWFAEGDLELGEEVFIFDVQMGSSNSCGRL